MLQSYEELSSHEHSEQIKMSSTKRPNETDPELQDASKRGKFSDHGGEIDETGSMEGISEEPKIDPQTEEPYSSELMGSELQVDDAFIEKSLQAFAPGTMNPSQSENNKWHLESMQTALYPHQMFGAAWLISRESGSEFPQGGILADEMGLGKTIQAIAMIVNDLHIGQKGTRVRQRAKKRMTLVVSLNAGLADQWEEELERHCGVEHEILDKLAHYHGDQKIGGRNAVRRMIMNHRVILTTYAEVVRQYPKQPAKVPTRENAEEKRRRKLAEKKGPLFQMHFHRIILDEGQKIKNRNSLVSRACRALTADHYWILSGTPIQNYAEELFPYFEFLKFPGASDFKEFNKSYFRKGKPLPQLGIDLRRVVLRRTGEDRILGKKLVEIPPGNTSTCLLEFTPMEKKLYDENERDTRNDIARMLRESDEGGLTEGQKKKVMDRAMKVRLDTAHWLLNAYTIPDYLEPPEMEELIRAVRKIGPAKTSSKKLTLARLPSQPEGLVLDDETTQRMCAYLQDLKLEREKQTLKWKELAVPSLDKKRLRRLRKKTLGSDVFKYRTAKWLATDFPLVMSSKLDMVLEQILKWLSEDREKKIVVFTQFIEVINILNRALKVAGVGSEMYHWKMTHADRRSAKSQFQTDKDKKVFLMSLLAGGTGLNLAFASRMINIDLWWNKAQEEQAFARVRRIGQMHETELVRYAVRGTIDERIIALQNKKSVAIDAILAGKLDSATKALCDMDILHLACGSTSFEGIDEDSDDRSEDTSSLIDDSNDSDCDWGSEDYEYKPDGNEDTKANGNEDIDEEKEDDNDDDSDDDEEWALVDDE